MTPSEQPKPTPIDVANQLRQLVGNQQLLEDAATQLEQLESAIELQHQLWSEQRALADAWRLAASELASYQRGCDAGWPQATLERAARSCRQATQRAEHLDQLAGEPVVAAEHLEQLEVDL